MIRGLKRHALFLALDPAGYVRSLSRTGTGLAVRSGPFAGMPYITRATCSAYPCKITGTYEKELHPAMAEILARPFGTVLNLGTAEGYYAVGLARHYPQARAIVFEGNPKGVKLLRQLARRNGVEARLDIRGYATGADVATLLSGKGSEGETLLVCDVEGAEAEIFFSFPPALLARTTLVIETHEGAAPGVTDRLAALLEPSHRVTRVPLAPRTPDDLPFPLAGWARAKGSEWAVQTLLDEGREPDPGWLYAVPK